MPEIDATARRLRAVTAANTRWAFTEDRAAATAPGRAAWLKRFADQVDPDGVLPAEERERRALQLRRAHMARLSAASAKARAVRKRAGS